VLLIHLWISDELSFDKYHEKDARLYQAMYHEQTSQSIKTSGQTPYFLADALKKEIPEIEFAAVATPPLFFPDFAIQANEKHQKAVGKFAEEDFFRIFSYSLLAGRPEEVLKDKNSVVISESLAKKLFNSIENSVGKPFNYSLLHLQNPVFISGVFKDIPANSSEHFDFILSFQVINDLMGFQNQAYTWDRTDPFYTYVVLKDGADVNVVNSKLEGYISAKSKSSPFSLFLKPYSDGYLYGNYENGVPDGGRIDYVVLFSLVGIFILIIACINFINLSTAKARTRLKEIGIKKVVGANRRSLIVQYLSETMLLSSLSLLVAISVVYLILPEFNIITGKTLHVQVNYGWIVSLVGIVLITGLIAGIYPALYISGFHPSRILKGQLSSSFTEILVRKGLVIFQFTLSIIFIVSVWVVYQQTVFIQNKNLGYDKQNLVYFPADGNINGNASAFLDEVKKFHGVASASSMFGGVTGVNNGLPGFIEYGGKKITMYGIGVNYDMLETLGIRIKQGRLFSRALDTEGDTLKWIFNEAAVRAIGEPNLVGKVISDREIIGIVKDFHFQSLREEVKPFAFRLEPNYTMDIWVRIQPGNESETIKFLKKTYAKFNPELTFTYSFLDQAYQAQYISEQRVAILAKYFAGLAIVISCLGLFGLAAFTAERRKKEIGIRKLLGSSEINIVYLLSTDFTRMVIIAMVIAMPLSYAAAREWLNTFAYAIDLQWWYFAGGGLIALVIAWITVGGLTIRAAASNPVESLKCE
jgi:ABC-type antimicrobial peptide transport system permease subunit